MNICHAYGTAPGEEEAIALLQRALDIGYTFFDTAAIYGGGTSERLIRKAIMHRRSEFTLASKCVLDMIDDRRVLDGRPETIQRTLEGALARLETDHINLYYLHRLDPKVPVEESVGALVRAKEAGKIGAIGLSEVSAATVRRAHAVHPIAAVQSEYSPWVRNPEVAVLDACRALDIAFVAFSPVGRGFFTDALDSSAHAEGDLRNQLPRFIEPNWSRNLPLLEKFKQVAREAGCTPAQLSLAWVLARDDRVVPIPGTRSIAHLEENLAAATLSIGQEYFHEVDQIFRPGAVAGGRYPAALQIQIDTERLPEELAQ
jgi:aryl-alcohol dehydrogenase-like predicted oxidoreductase